jgi:hypothetical protein
MNMAIDAVTNMAWTQARPQTWTQTWTGKDSDMFMVLDMDTGTDTNMYADSDAN